MNHKTSQCDLKNIKNLQAHQHIDLPLGKND